MKNYLRSWNVMRVVRLVLGVMVVVQGIQANQWLIAGLGALFAMMPLFNVGCCTTAGCSTPIRKVAKENGEITYEEVKAK